MFPKGRSTSRTRLFNQLHTRQNRGQNQSHLFWAEAEMLQAKLIPDCLECNSKRKDCSFSATVEWINCQNDGCTEDVKSQQNRCKNIKKLLASRLGVSLVQTEKWQFIIRLNFFPLHYLSPLCFWGRQFMALV